MSLDEPDAPRRERLQRVLDAARRVGRTAQQLLMLARADQSASDGWQHEDIDLAAVVESMVGEQLSAAEAAGIDFGAEVGPTSVRGVDWLLAEAARALTENAAASSMDGRSSRSRTRASGSRRSRESACSSASIARATRAARVAGSGSRS